MRVLVAGIHKFLHKMDRRKQSYQSEAAYSRSRCRRSAHKDSEKDENPVRHDFPGFSSVAMFVRPDSDRIEASRKRQVTWQEWCLSSRVAVHASVKEGGAEKSGKIVADTEVFSQNLGSYWLRLRAS